MHDTLAEYERMDSAALVDHILERYHDGHRRDLAELVPLARKVETVHATDPDAPIGLAAALETLASEMEAHMLKEEQILFPAMRGTPFPGIRAPIWVMRADHDAHVESIARIRKIAHEMQPPAHACRSWRRLYAGTARLLEDLERHVAIENEVLFPRFETGRGAA